MKTTPHRFLATGVRVGEIAINLLRRDSANVKVDYLLLGEEGQVLGHAVYYGSWSEEVIAALVQFQEKLEKFAIESFFDVPPKPGSTEGNYGETNQEAEQM